jgi:hypothetical protein
LRVEEREGRNEEMFAERHLQRIGNGSKAFNVLLKTGANLFFLLKEGLVDLEVFEREMVN